MTPLSKQTLTETSENPPQYILIFLYPYLNHRIAALLKHRSIPYVIAASAGEVLDLVRTNPPAVLLALSSPSSSEGTLVLDQIALDSALTRLPIAVFLMSKRVEDEAYRSLAPSSVETFFYQDFEPRDLLNYIEKRTLKD